MALRSDASGEAGAVFSSTILSPSEVCTTTLVTSALLTSTSLCAAVAVSVGAALLLPRVKYNTAPTAIKTMSRTIVVLKFMVNQNSKSGHEGELKLPCHPERSEGSRPFERLRSFASLRMTKGKLRMTKQSDRIQSSSCPFVPFRVLRGPSLSLIPSGEEDAQPREQHCAGQTDQEQADAPGLERARAHVADSADVHGGRADGNQRIHMRRPEDAVHEQFAIAGEPGRPDVPRLQSRVAVFEEKVAHELRHRDDHQAVAAIFFRRGPAEERAGQVALGSIERRVRDFFQIALAPRFWRRRRIGHRKHRPHLKSLALMRHHRRDAGEEPAERPERLAGWGVAVLMNAKDRRPSQRLLDDVASRATGLLDRLVDADDVRLHLDAPILQDRR